MYMMRTPSADLVMTTHLGHTLSNLGMGYMQHSATLQMPKAWGLHLGTASRAEITASRDMSDFGISYLSRAQDDIMHRKHDAKVQQQCKELVTFYIPTIR